MITALLFALLPPQDSRGSGDPVAEFHALPALKKAAITRRIADRVARDDDPALRRFGAMATTGDWPELGPATPHDPERFAKGVAPARTIEPEDSALHRAARARYPRVPFLDDLRAAVVYDWGSARIVRVKPLGFDEVFENCANGWLPGSDVVIAQLLHELDTDKKQQALASYLGHVWADLEAHAFAGITLYEAWYSGKQIDVPDVDAIPFALQIMGDHSFVSPIPGDQRRARLYERIKEQAFVHRKYRSLRLAAAAAFVRAEPVLDPTYAPLVPRFHLLWAQLDDDKKQMADLLRHSPDREALIASIDHDVQKRPEIFELRERRKRELASAAEKVVQIALEELHRDP